MLLDRDMMTQIQEITSIVLDINGLGFPIADEFKITVILKALPLEWSTICTILLNQPNLKLQGTIDALLGHENVLKWEQGDTLFV